MLMCLAALEAPLNLPIDGSLYGEEVVFVANDWHAALVPVYLASKYRPHGVYRDARSVLAIHNLRHQVGARCMSCSEAHHSQMPFKVTYSPCSMRLRC